MIKPLIASLTSGVMPNQPRASRIRRRATPAPSNQTYTQPFYYPNQSRTGSNDTGSEQLVRDHLPEATALLFLIDHRSKRDLKPFCSRSESNILTELFTFRKPVGVKPGNVPNSRRADWLGGRSIWTPKLPSPFTASEKTEGAKEPRFPITRWLTRGN